MTRPHSPLILAAVLSLLTLAAIHSAVAAELPEPGPENGGLRLRLAVEPAKANAGGFDVRIDLMNVSSRPITLTTAWEREDTGEVKDYLEAATSIESFPAFEPWKGGLAATIGNFLPAQAKQVLPAGETLTVRWQTKGQHLKNRVSDPGHVQNPTFSLPGLYGVHANLDVVTSTGAFRLRSNEQLVSFGGSRETPKHTYGPVWHMNAEKKTAMLGLGSHHKVAVGDRFDITSKTASWRLTITEVRPRYSEAKLELLGDLGDAASQQPPQGASATLVRE